MMASGPPSSPIIGFREDDVQRQLKLEQPPLVAVVPSSSSASPAPPPPKKKRNQPGNPNPDAEVIALSPKTLLATNRFVCEVCKKGFQREQNLQLHRRGHNLPWKLRQKSSKEPRRRVYLCPVPTCVHHEPSRALGDLTGIKKHYCRKHGEKKWKCDKCSKRYAVQSDWKAHTKTCGTREYRCECGTLFSRRDSFITHRAFCDALSNQGNRPPNLTAIDPMGRNHLYTTESLPLPNLNPTIPPPFHSNLGTPVTSNLNHLLSTSSSSFFLDEAQLQPKPFPTLMQLPNTIPTLQTTPPSDLFNLSFFANNSTSTNENIHMLLPEQATNCGLIPEPTIFDGSATLPQTSIMGLLQKASQMGGSTSGNGGQVSLGVPFGEGANHEAQLQDLMNSLAGEQDGGFDGYKYNQGLGIVEDPKQLRAINGPEGLTRDFLGVGGPVQLGPLDSETKVPLARRSM